MATKAPDDVWREWVATASIREAANTGPLEVALHRVLLLRRDNPTRKEFDDSIAMLQQFRDQALYDGDIEGTPAERFEALVRIWTDYGESAYNPQGTYQDFLDSTYWKIIAAYVKWLRGGQCQMCDSRGNLHTHHKTYRHRGSEHKHLDDLVVVCAKCHSSHHGR
jgi:5-methylcytosine-specific restriction endonuclease McrA